MISPRLIVLALLAVPGLASAQADAQRGFQLFMSVGCYECHGTVGQGGGIAGPRIAPDPPSADRLLAIVRKPLKEMPPYNARVLSDADVQAIHAYLASIKPPPPIDSLAALKPEAK